MNRHRISARRRLKQLRSTNLVFSVLIFMTVGFFIYSRLPDSIISAWNDSVNTINDDAEFFNHESEFEKFLLAASKSANVANEEESIDKDETKKPIAVTNKVDPELTKGIKPSNVESTTKVKEEYVPLSCGPRYQSCPKTKPGFINVHLVPHTHDDVGWRKTFEEYYTGSGDDVNKISIMRIINSVVDELQVDPSRRFIYVEMAYFSKWWKEQSVAKRNVVRDLVSSGRLEFINGGWCMNDEATTHYADIIDQMALGLKFLNQTFGECGRPKIGWQIDPFGHSKEHASINFQLGFDGLFLGRVDYQDQQQRIASKNMEMVWLGDKTSGIEEGIFTSLLYDHYLAPNGFCFDGELNYCADKPINDNPNSKEYDVKERVQDFLKFCQQQANAYNTNNILIPMGHDFTYQSASNWFTNIDKLIEHGNKHQEKGGDSGKFNLFYSTPSCYAKAVSDQNQTWPIKTDDFFPYGNKPNTYWTGFFTSRPTSKYMIRQGSNLLQSCKQMASALSMKGKTYKGDISVMKEAMAVMQHHDAVTGTEKQHVADDYTRLLHMGIEECLKTETSFYEQELPKEKSVTLPQVSYCRLNLSECEVTETAGRFVINVYNSLSRAINKYIRVPIPDKSTSHEIFDSKGNSIAWQLVPISELVKKLPDRKSPSTDKFFFAGAGIPSVKLQGSTSHELLFLAADLPPLGSKSFYIQSTLSEVDVKRDYFNDKSTSTPSADHIISNEKFTITVDGKSGLLRSIKADNILTNIEQEFLWYAGNLPVMDENKVSHRPSGAYAFRPNGTTPYTIPMKDGIKVTVHKGPLVEEIHQYYSNWLSQVIRLYRGQSHVELDWIVGPIPTDDNISKEIVTRFTTSMNSTREFYTDSNGRQTLKRTINKRESFQYNVTEPVAGNYYPVNSHIYLKDQKEDKQLSILVDRAQGGASLDDGHLELMVHRRLVYDDAIGVDEVLNERQSNGDGIVVCGTHFLMLGGSLESARLRPLLSQELYRQPRISFIATDLSLADWLSRYNTEVQLLSHSLPDSVNLLTLEPYSDEEFLIRLEHIYEPEEGESLSAPVTVSLAELFKGFEITSLEETALGGNMWKKELNRLQWNIFNKDKTSINPRSPTKSDEISTKEILLYPMQIRSFVIRLVQTKGRHPFLRVF